jgi:hypothetical protein
VLFERAGRQIAVVANDTGDAAPGAALSYRAPAVQGALHVVVDAPVGSQGRSDVSATLEGSECAVTVVERQDSTGGHPGIPLAFGLTATCAVLEEPGEPSSAGGAAGASGTGANGAAVPRPQDMSGGCGCRVSEGIGLSLAAIAAAVAALFASRRRVRPRR